MAKHEGGATTAVKEPPLARLLNTGKAVQASAPAREFNPDYAVGEKAPGKMIFLITLKGHKSRVWDKKKEVPVYLETLPVWAENEGAAWLVFQNYHGGMTTIHKPDIVACPETPVTE